MEDNIWTFGQIESGHLVPSDEVLNLMADVLDRLAGLIGENRAGARDLVSEAWTMIREASPGTSISQVAEGLIACGRDETKVPSFVVLARYLETAR